MPGGETLLRIVLMLVGAVFAAIGVNIGSGGVETLGWQFPPAGVTAADPITFARHDNNVRFLGGIFGALGLVIAASALRPTLRLAAAAVLITLPVGGVARLLQSGYSVIGDPAFAGSLLAEFIGAPLLAYWIWRSQRAAPNRNRP